MIKLTKNECRGIEGIVTSDYDEGAINRCVWTWSANLFDNKRSFSGVIASLSKKGCVRATEDGQDSTLRLTREGWEAYKAAPVAFRDVAVDTAELDHIDTLLGRN